MMPLINCNSTLRSVQSIQLNTLLHTPPCLAIPIKSSLTANCICIVFYSFKIGISQYSASIQRLRSYPFSCWLLFYYASSSNTLNAVFMCNCWLFHLPHLQIVWMIYFRYAAVRLKSFTLIKQFRCHSFQFSCYSL